MSTIEERIAKHERLLIKARATYTRASDTKAKAEGNIIYHDTAIEKLKAKLAKQQEAKDLKILALKRQNEIENQKDKVFGKALVESGAITEEQKEKAEKLPLPEGQTAQRLPREKVD